MLTLTLYTVYALRKLGFERIYLRNRSKPRAQALKDYFPAHYNIDIVEGLTEQDLKYGAPLAIVGTIPSEGIVKREDVSSGSIAGEKVILEPFMTSRASGVTVEMACESTHTS